MIEGLIVLPWYQDDHGNPSTEFMRDCTSCKEQNSVAARQAMACGWEPRVENARAWSHPASRDGGDTKAPESTTCPGYTCGLPAVTDVAFHVFPHWEKSGNFTARFPDGDAPPAVAESIEVLNDSILRFRAWRLKKNPEKT